MKQYIREHWRWAPVLALFAGQLQAQAPPSISVGANVHVSRARAGDEHNELWIATDPRDVNRLIGCAIVSPRGTPRYQTAAYMSMDGGRTWQLKLVAIPGLGMADPGCAFGPDGTAYFASRGFDERQRYTMRLYRSNDDGATWDAAPDQPFSLDPLFIGVDDTRGRYHGRIYVFGAHGVTAVGGGSLSAFTIWRSVDGGRTVSGPVKVVARPPHYVQASGNAAILSDGTLAIPLTHLQDLQTYSGIRTPVTPNAELHVAISEDGGERFTTVKVSDWFNRPFGTIATMPVIAVDRSSGPFKDRLYVAWVDVRSGRAEILLSHSNDQGKTWSRPTAVNDDAPRADGEGPDDFMPTLAVNLGGVVGVQWYDRRDHPDNLGWTTRFTASLDGGETFLPSVKVSEVGFVQDSSKQIELFSSSYGGANRHDGHQGPVEAALRLSRGQFQGGDYAGLAADANGVFHSLFVDNRTGVGQMWTAKVRVTGVVAANGFVDLASAADVSARATLDLEDAFYDRASGTVTANVYLVNSSEDTLRAPLFVRVLSLTSAMGRPTITNADRGGPGPGAVLDFTSLIEGGSLAPGARSSARRVVFALEDARPVRPLRSTDAVTDFVRFRAKILSGAK
jgi:hypothetical protein